MYEALILAGTAYKAIREHVTFMTGIYTVLFYWDVLVITTKA